LSATHQQNSATALLGLIVLNLVPLASVFIGDWQSFDLIFLYWMENVVIGAFSLARMVVRPYIHPLDLIFPLLIAPFFVLHFGAFCWGHGTFVVSLFGPESLAGSDLSNAALTAVTDRGLLLPLAALAAIHALDWFRDVRARGLGADDLKELMFKPYRRIVVLHLTILGAGFALGALDEPTVGLLALVLLKTASDIWHWRQDEAAGAAENTFEFSPHQLKEMQEKFPRPMLEVNGEERTFDSFSEMRDSREVRMAQALMRLIGAAKELKEMNAYFDLRVAEEERAKPAAGRRRQWAPTDAT
jgi:hypothetical protein